MRGRVGLVAALRLDQLAAMQRSQRRLDRALRQSRLLRDLVMTEANLPGPVALRAAVRI